MKRTALYTERSRALRLLAREDNVSSGEEAAGGSGKRVRAALATRCLNVPGMAAGNRSRSGMLPRKGPGKFLAYPEQSGLSVDRAMAYSRARIPGSLPARPPAHERDILAGVQGTRCEPVPLCGKLSHLLGTLFVREECRARLLRKTYDKHVAETLRSTP